MADDTAQTEEGPGATATPAAPPARLKTTYEDEIRPKLQEEFGYASPMQHPRLVKITLSMGVGEAKQNSKALDEAMAQMGVIAGQKPMITRARKSIAQFQLREGMAIGCKVTLRGARMWEFLDRLQSVALPRIRDFRGVNPDMFDGRGNYNLGLREQTIRIYLENEDNINFLRVISPLVSVDSCTADQLVRMMEQNISWVNTTVGVVRREVVYTCVVPVQEFEGDPAVLGDAIVKLARRADQMETLLFGRDRKNRPG